MATSPQNPDPVPTPPPHPDPDDAGNGNPPTKPPSISCG